MNQELPSDSDEDYIPEEGNVDLPSEEDSDGDDEEVDIPKNVGSRKRKLKSNGRTRKKKQIDTEKCGEVEDVLKKEMTEDEKKQHEEDLWANFLETADTRSKPKENTPKNSSNSKVGVEKNHKRSEEKPKTVAVTEVFKFAGEEIKVTREVARDSLEARLTSTATSSNSVTGSKDASHIPRGRGQRLGATAILGQIGKKSKISTLEKSKLDWDRFKTDEGITNEIENFNKGKQGYLDRQEFLQRTDQRQFEIEKQLRTARKNNR